MTWFEEIVVFSHFGHASLGFSLHFLKKCFAMLLEFERFSGDKDEVLNASHRKLI